VSSIVSSPLTVISGRGESRQPRQREGPFAKRVATGAAKEPKQQPVGVSSSRAGEPDLDGMEDASRRRLASSQSSPRLLRSRPSFRPGIPRHRRSPTLGVLLAGMSGWREPRSSISLPTFASRHLLSLAIPFLRC